MTTQSLEPMRYAKHQWLLTEIIDPQATLTLTSIHWTLELTLIYRNVST